MTAKLNFVFGPCGAGKTTYAYELARREGAVPFVLDDWGVRLFGPDAPGAFDFGWMMERLGRCQALIWTTAEAVLATGTPVILDLGMMRRAHRDRFREMAAQAGHGTQWHFVDAPQSVRRARVAARNADRGETFAQEVPPELFEMFEAMYEPPAPEELSGAVLIVGGAAPREHQAGARL